MFSSVVNVLLLLLIKYTAEHLIKHWIPDEQQKKETAGLQNMDKSGKKVVLKKRLYNLICFSFFHVSTYTMSTLSGMIHMSCKMMHDVFSNILRRSLESCKQWYFFFPLLYEQSFPVYFTTVEHAASPSPSSCKTHTVFKQPCQRMC